jgi:exopolyphosphatase / guanosine-5'-triphosphate,3'-diphosphate pyrophosphatase
VSHVAAVDIGTNSVRLLITDQHGRPLVREMEITRLGQGVDVAGTLHPDAIARTAAVLAQYRALIERHAAVRVRATATSAARDASNREVFFDAATRALGTRPELLSGQEEAELSFRGATHGLDPKLAPFLVIDIGGGSTELVIGSDAPSATISLGLGCVRMTERHLQHDPATPAEISACREDVRAVLSTVRLSVPVHEARSVVGLAGTITTLAHVQLGRLQYSPEVTHHSRLSAADIDALCSRLVAMSLSARTQLMPAKRAEVIVGGAIALQTLMRELALAELIVSESDILDGLAASLV